MDSFDEIIKLAVEMGNFNEVKSQILMEEEKVRARKKNDILILSEDEISSLRKMAFMAGRWWAEKLPLSHRNKKTVFAKAIGIVVMSRATTCRYFNISNEYCPNKHLLRQNQGQRQRRISRIWMMICHFRNY